MLATKLPDKRRGYLRTVYNSLSWSMRKLGLVWDLPGASALIIGENASTDDGCNWSCPFRKHAGKQDTDAFKDLDGGHQTLPRFYEHTHSE
jgi:hypothetical protein